MNYESSILKRLIEVYGVVGNPRYISEIIKQFIVQGKECYPNLFTYQADWLAHIDEFGLTPEYTVSYTGQHIYAPNTKEKPVKSAILSGNTLVNIVNNDSWVRGTGKDGNLFTQNISIKKGQTYTVIGKTESSDVIDELGDAPAFRIRTGGNSSTSLFFIQQSDAVFKQTFTNNENDTIHLRFFNQKTNYKKLMIIEGDHTNVDIPYFEGMQSVKTPVLTTTGKNLFDEKATGLYDETIGKIVITNSQPVGITKIQTIRLEKGTYTLSLNNVSVDSTKPVEFRFNDFMSSKLIVNSGANYATFTVTESNQYDFIIFAHGSGTINRIEVNIQLEKNSINTLYEPYKSNILSCLEPVELGSVGEVKDELNLLTQQLTQRTETRPYQEGDELNSEFVTDMTNTRYKLAQEVVKTVDLTIHDKDHQKVERLTSFEDGTHFTTSSQDGSLLPTLTVDVATDLEETLMVCSLEGNTM